MIVLGADEVVMGPISELGPIDPLVKHPAIKTFGYLFRPCAAVLNTSKK
jgi:hypothetical protein